ncbi:hypothetical protein GCM10009745_65500 [Kribbella yunnanensis]|uniref:Class I SAM-dependent methyltransferase n=1 Tax=Kribbella yunnanensis TaxID=190194 RepID=A0ABP4UP18_9ACTN
MDVLGIEVDPSLLQRWAGWLAPPRQPFFLTPTEAAELKLIPESPALSPELRDTYELWNLANDLEVVWLDEDAFHAQPRDVRAELIRAQARHGRGAVPTITDWADLLDAQVLRDQADGHHFVWWPTLVEPHREAVLKRVVSEWQHPCQRLSVPNEIWHAASAILPQAQPLSGTFAKGSRGNPSANGSATSCFATPRRPRRPPRNRPRLAQPPRQQHPPAVTLGAGWALHKPSQEWLSPHQVLTVQDLIQLAPPGLTLHRHTLNQPT